MAIQIRRRKFIVTLGGVAAAWPLAASAQQAVGVRRIGVLSNAAADDPEFSRRLRVFVQELERMGWTDGRNLRIEYRWAAGDADRVRNYATELVALAPDVILASGGTTVGPLGRRWRLTCSNPLREAMPMKTAWGWSAKLTRSIVLKDGTGLAMPEAFPGFLAGLPGTGKTASVRNNPVSPRPEAMHPPAWRVTSLRPSFRREMRSSTGGVMGPNGPVGVTGTTPTPCGRSSLAAWRGH